MNLTNHGAPSVSRCLIFVLLALVPAPLRAQGSADYYRHVFFDNSLTSDSYFSSRGTANGASYLELNDWRLPVDTKTFLTPPNALRVQWQSQAGGGWEAEIHLDNHRNRYPAFKGRNLYFWCFAPEAIAADDLPMLVLSDTFQGLQVAEFPQAFTEPLPLAKFAGSIPAGKWIQVRIPMSEFRTGSIYEFQPEGVQNVVFHQGRADGVRHTLIIDEVRIDDDAPKHESESIPPPANVRAVGFDRHVEVRWDQADSPSVARYIIYRSLDGKDFQPPEFRSPEPIASKISSESPALPRNTKSQPQTRNTSRRRCRTP